MKAGVFPCRYIKIVPLMAWAANFTYSIWYVELRGVQEPSYVDRVLSDFNAVCPIRLSLRSVRCLS